ncbi:contact-dependent growth inhibition system immunity protein [Kitasatospora sp. CM 4170]|uniref:Contact-dependent growth inhibition system immunity protein n=1 Tax=Kitasatospora aburaviensis TaxID=67265 RepID=A0ABW1F709_9ACTN|nr:contact-dependent growth inhibition system immunity protein [Kitasatospora sp. CM 4170]WNM43329.1 contact-dependent growth inhibition system immunity protein [Kitasatospora sp. CM 4170]
MTPVPPVNRGRSPEELERDAWPDPPADATRLVTTVHALRRRPIGTLTVEDLRRLLGQQVGVPFVLPLALEILRRNPMAEGDLYEGDLLAAVLALPPEVWHASPHLAREARAVLAALPAPPPGRPPAVGAVGQRGLSSSRGPR